MKRPPTKLSYANVVSTIALFLAISGGAAFAATKIQTTDIAPGAVKTANLHKRAVASGKLAIGAVRSNQIANGAVGSDQISNGAVGGAQIAAGSIGSTQIKSGAIQPSDIATGSLTSAQVKPGSIQPSSLQVPLNFLARPTGGSIAVPVGEPVAYPLSDATWMQTPGQVVVIFGGGTTSLAYDGSGSGSCQVFLEIAVNGKQVGGGQVSTSSETLDTAEQNFGAGTEIDPPQAATRSLQARVGSNGDCTADSTIDSSRFRVIAFG